MKSSGLFKRSICSSDSKKNFTPLFLMLRHFEVSEISLVEKRSC